MFVSVGGVFFAKSVLCWNPGGNCACMTPGRQCAHDEVYVCRTRELCAHVTCIFMMIRLFPILSRGSASSPSVSGQVDACTIMLNILDSSFV